MVVDYEQALNSYSQYNTNTSILVLIFGNNGLQE